MRVQILFDEGPYAQGIPLPNILLRISPIDEKGQVVWTLRNRFTDICQTFSEREMLMDSVDHFSILSNKIKANTCLAC